VGHAKPGVHAIHVEIDIACVVLLYVPLGQGVGALLPTGQ